MAVYACSDLHGCMKFYKEIKKMLQPEDKVFFLGDAGDRGPEPWETIQAITRIYTSIQGGGLVIAEYAVHVPVSVRLLLVGIHVDDAANRIVTG